MSVKPVAWTPGPWRFHKHGEHSQWLGNVVGSYGIGENGIEHIRTITCQTRYESTPGEACANAVLIEAAPELAEALAKLVKRCRERELYGVILDEAEKLLARITPK